MDFRVVQRFACTPDQYWARTRGAEFDAAVAKEANVKSDTLEATHGPDASRERVRIHLGSLGGALQKALGNQNFSYVQTVDSDNRKYTTTWSIVTDQWSERIHCKGSSSVLAVPGGCERVVTGTIEVRVPLVGGAIERQIADTIASGYRKAEPIIRRFVEVRE